jgi:transcriptional regulator with XRE-family HTH domain
LIFKIFRDIIPSGGEKLMANIGVNIKRARRKLGWTQEELASRMGYKSKSTINKIELGINDIPQSKIVQFAEVLGVTPGYIMGWEQEPEDMGALAAMVLKDPGLLNLAKNYITLDEADRATVAALVESLAAKKKG